MTRVVVVSTMTRGAASAKPATRASCRRHPNRTATFVCRKYDYGYCDECCACPPPETYCKLREQCLIRGLCRGEGGVREGE